MVGLSELKRTIQFRARAGALRTAAEPPEEERLSGFLQLRICAPIDAASEAQLKQRSNSLKATIGRIAVDYKYKMNV